jgi:putative ABC transport system permease protein
VLASVALGVATWVAMSLLTSSLEKTSRTTATPLPGAADLYISNGDAGVLRSLEEVLARFPGVKSVRPLVIQRAVLPDLGHLPILVMGVNLAGDLEGSPWDIEIQTSDASPVQSFFLRCPSVLVGRELEEALPAETSRFNVLLAGRCQRFSRAGTIVTARGAAAPLAGNVVVLPCAAAAELVGQPDRVSRFDLSLLPGADPQTVQQDLERALQGQAEVWSPQGHDQRTQEMLVGPEVMFALCGVGALVVGLFLISNVLAVSVVERRFEIGLLRSLGATRGQVARHFLKEAALFGLVGALPGIPLGLALARLSLGPMYQVLSDVFLPLAAGEVGLTGTTVAHAVLAGLITSLLAGLMPALQAALEQPVQTLRRLPAVIHPGRRRLRLGSALASAVGGGVLLACKDVLPARVGVFGGLVLMLAAALLLVPTLAGLLARLFRPLTACLPGCACRLAADNLTRAPGRTGLVVAALAASVAMLVLTGGLIQNNEKAIRFWIDQNIAGDLFVTSGGPLSASGRTLPMYEAAGPALQQILPEAQLVPMRFRHLDYEHAGQTHRILLLALDAAAYHRANEHRQLHDLDLYQKLSQPGTALVSENFAALYGVRVGDTIELPGAEGPVSLRVVGTVIDYACTRGEVLVDRTYYRGSLDDLVDVFDVYLPPGADVESARQRVQQSPLAARIALCTLTKNEVRGHILGMVNRLYGLAYTQEVVMALVAVLGVLAALLISVLQRRRELGLLRALGSTQGQVFRSVLAEAVLLAIVGVTIGLILSLPMLWYTLRVLLFEESGFLFPCRFPWTMALIVVGVAVGCAAVAGVGPALQARRIRTAEALAYE